MNNIKQFYNTQTKQFIIRFITAFILFLIASIPFRAQLAIANVSDVRIAAVLNPILGLAYGWPAALGCAIANFIADIYSDYGIQAAIIGFLPQIVYGILPYYLWKKVVPTSSHRTRLDHPKKVVLIALIMIINSFIIGIAVGLMELTLANGAFLSTAMFVAFNDFNSCIVFGLPLLAILDFIYSKFQHNGKRKLSRNERIIIISTILQLITFNTFAVFCYYKYPDLNLKDKWSMIFSVSNYVIATIISLSVIVMFYSNYRYFKQSKLKIIKKPNGMLFVDDTKRLEFVSIPGRAFKDKVKADFLGYTNENVGKNDAIPSYETAWYTMISNQKGCPMLCSFCDCPAYGFYGNVSESELMWQIETILKSNDVTETKLFEVDFMRMGEPSLNPDILKFIENDLIDLVSSHIDADVIYPYVSTMLPKANKRVENFLLEFCRIKNTVYNGNAAIQFSINTTDEKTRNKIFNNRSLSLPEIAKIAEKMPIPKGRKYALNFAVTKDSIIDAKYIDSLFDKEKFLIKITPIHETFNAVDNGFVITTEYQSFDVYRKFEKSFIKLGWDVLIFLDTKGEDDDDLTCGKLLLSHEGGNL